MRYDRDSVSEYRTKTFQIDTLIEYANSMNLLIVEHFSTILLKCMAIFGANLKFIDLFTVGTIHPANLWNCYVNKQSNGNGRTDRIRGKERFNMQ